MHFYRHRVVYDYYNLFQDDISRSRHSIFENKTWRPAKESHEHGLYWLIHFQRAQGLPLWCAAPLAFSLTAATPPMARRIRQATEYRSAFHSRNSTAVEYVLMSAISRERRPHAIKASLSFHYATPTLQSLKPPLHYYFFRPRAKIEISSGYSIFVYNAIRDTFTIIFLSRICIIESMPASRTYFSSNFAAASRMAWVYYEILVAQRPPLLSLFQSHYL